MVPRDRVDSPGGQKPSSLPEFEPRTALPIASRYIDYAIPVPS